MTELELTIQKTLLEVANIGFRSGFRMGLCAGAAMAGVFLAGILWATR